MISCVRHEKERNRNSGNDITTAGGKQKAEFGNRLSLHGEIAQATTARPFFETRNGGHCLHF